jgi:hypothetical protein
MTRRRLALVLFAVLLACNPIWASASQETAHMAGIYIDFGNGETTMVLVPFSEDEISGIDLIERSSLPILTVGFGGLGDAVCMIEQTGCELSTCRRTLCQDGDRESPFWQYLQRSDNGEWVTSPLGASAGKVQDGDIDAWVWTGTPPELPALTLDDIRARTGLPKGNVPAIYTTTTAAEDESNSSRQWLIGGGMIAIAVIAGGSLVVLRNRQHATR